MALALLFLSLAALTAGCGRESRTRPERSAPDARADAASGSRLAIGTPVSRADSARTKPTPIASPSLSALPAPDASPSAAPPDSAPAANGANAAGDQAFQPPILKKNCTLATPPGKHGMVDLELRVNTEGWIDEFRMVGGDRDTSLVRAALDCVRVMQFYPARRGGQAVEAWYRRRFTFGVN